VGIKPNIILIAIISVACLRGEKEGAIYGFAAGLLQDCYFSTYIGSFVFLYSFIGYFCGFLLKNFYRENFILPMAAVVVATFVYNFIFYVLNVLLRGYTDVLYFIVRIILPEMIYNALASLIVYNLYLFINNRLEEHEKYKHRFFDL
jgi:rod shape-determining protein MreD